MSGPPPKDQLPFRLQDLSAYTVGMSNPALLSSHGAGSCRPQNFRGGAA